MSAGAGGGPHVSAYDASTLAQTSSFFADAQSFSGGVRVATGDVNGDGVADIIAAPGAGGGGAIKIFDANGALEASFTPFAGTFTGGIFVAAGDVDGDGRADTICGADSGGGPAVRVYSGANLSLLQSFFAYDPAFTGGVRVAAGDINGDGRADLITAAGAGGGPHLKSFSGADLSVLNSFEVFTQDFTGGVYVSYSASPVPEPATMVALGLGLLAIRRRKRG